MISCPYTISRRSRIWPVHCERNRTATIRCSRRRLDRTLIRGVQFAPPGRPKARITPPLGAAQRRSRKRGGPLRAAGPRPHWNRDETRRHECRPRVTTCIRRRSPLRGAPRRLLASQPQGANYSPAGGSAAAAASVGVHSAAEVEVYAAPTSPRDLLELHGGA